MNSANTPDPETGQAVAQHPPERRYVYNGESSGPRVNDILPRSNRPVRRRKRSPFNIIAALVAISLRSEEHTSELQSRLHLVCRLLLEKKKKYTLWLLDTEICDGI